MAVQFCWGVYLGDTYRKPILKFEQLILGFSLPLSKHQTAKEKNTPSDDALSPINIRPTRTDSPAFTNRFPNVSATSNTDDFSKRSDDDKTLSKASSLSAIASVPPASLQPEYQNPKTSAIINTSQHSLPAPATVAQLSTRPNASPSRIAESTSQAFDTEISNVAKPVVADRIDTNSSENTDSSSSKLTLPSQESIPLVRRVKVMVDEAYVYAHSNWISEVMRTVGELSRVYRLEFGIIFDLIGVVCWSDVFPYMSNNELLFSLYNHPNEGADIVLGFVNRSVKAEALDNTLSEIQSRSHHAFGLVGTNEHFNPVFLPSAFLSLGMIFGAKRVTDTNSDAYQLGSWMSQSTVRADRSFWIDLPNKRRIIEHKASFAIAGNTSPPLQEVLLSTK